jgi:DNA-binding CsgD family transcriptional regulator
MRIVLTKAEKRDLYLASLGFSIKEIAKVRGVTHNGVEYNLRRARIKLEAQNITEAVARAIRLKLI